MLLNDGEESTSAPGFGSSARNDAERSSATPDPQHLSPEYLGADRSAQERTSASTPRIKVEGDGANCSPPQPTVLTGGAATAAVRSAFAEAGGQLLGHNLSYLPSGSGANLMSSSMSVTSSPPRSLMTPEQREFRRQMDQVRRDTKTVARIRRANTPYAHSANVPAYTTDAAPTRLLAEPYIPGPRFQDPAPSTLLQPPSPRSSCNILDCSSDFHPSTSHLYVGTELNVMPAVMAIGGARAVGVVQSRPKPQCWEHGCNGKQFSTFSNLLRHQREKSGQAPKATCPNCGAEFTRTTARNGHLLHHKCKQRNNGSNK